MKHNRAVLRLTALALVASGVSELALGSEGSPAPRYLLRVGNEITFRRSTESSYNAQFRGKARETRYGSKEEWTVWVVRENDDGSKRLILRYRTKTVFPGRESRTPPDSYLAYWDVFDDGRSLPNPTIGFFVDPTRVFPRLPEGADAWRGSWQASIAWDGSTLIYKPLRDRSDGGDVWTFEERREGPMERVAGKTSKSVFTFDRKSGLVRKVASETRRGYPVEGKVIGTTDAPDVRERDPSWVEELARQADVYFEASERYNALYSRGQSDSALVPEALALLEGVREKVTAPDLWEHLDDQIRRHKATAMFASQAADERAKLIGKPAPGWETRGLDGKTHSLKDYRGKVVLLDFWERGCGWCIRSMPQLKQVVDAFEGQPVVLLGMNLDEDEANARFVVEQMGLDYPVLKAQGIVENYQALGIPHLVIVDPAGDVSGIHSGYSPTLRDDIVKHVEGLLAGAIAP